MNRSKIKNYLHEKLKKTGVIPVYSFIDKQDLSNVELSTLFYTPVADSDETNCLHSSLEALDSLVSQIEGILNRETDLSDVFRVCRWSLGEVFG